MTELHATYDDAWRAIYWTRILGDGGVPVAPLIAHEVVPILDRFGVVTRHLAPDRATDERDAHDAGRIMRRAHDTAFGYVESEGTSWTLCGLQLRNFVVHRGSLYLVGLGNVEQLDRASARRRAARDFSSELREDVTERAFDQFLASYDLV